MTDLTLAEEFIHALTGATDAPMSWQTFDDNKQRKDPRLAEHRHGAADKSYHWLADANDKGAGVFVTVNATDGKGRQRSNVTEIRALWADKDDGVFLHDELPLTPNMVVRTARGMHVYWLLEPGEPLERAEGALHGIAAKLKTDAQVCRINQVMRVPGFMHRKSRPQLVSFDQFHSRHFTIDQVLEGLGAKYVEIDEATEATIVTQPAGNDRVEAARAYVAAMGPAISGEGGDSHTFRVACVGGDFGLTPDQFWPLLVEWNEQCSPPWPLRELKAKLRNASKYRTRPVGNKATVEAPTGKKIEALSMADMLTLWRTGKNVSIPSGIKALDRVTGGGLPVHQVTTLVGYTGVGKSELARQIRTNVAMRGHPVVHVDVELGAKRIVERDICQTAEIAPVRLRRPPEEHSALEVEAIETAAVRLERRPVLTISRGGGMPLADLGKAIDEALATYPKDKPVLVVLDSAQRLAGSAPGDNARMQMQYFMWWVEGLARNREIAILLTSEQKRGADGKAPGAAEALTSGAESRSLEFVSDVMLAMVPQGEVTEDDASDSDVESSRTISLLVAKNREGTTGYIKENLVFKGPYWQMLTEKRRGVTHEAVLELLADGKPRSKKSIAMEIKGRKASIIRAVDELGEDGLIVHSADDGWTLNGRNKAVPESGTPIFR
jgi:KaiC/GvpD/RAD55 family RecA-like ATPase